MANVHDKTSYLHELGLVEWFQTDLHEYLVGRLQDEDEARDIAQIAFMRVLERENPAAIENFKSYLFKAANNIAIDRLRKKRLDQRLFQALQEQDTQHTNAAITPEHGAIYHDRLEKLFKALDELAPKCRQAFLMQRLDGLTYDEIAKILNISSSMVKKHLRKALTHCHKRLGPIEQFLER